MHGLVILFAQATSSNAPPATNGLSDQLKWFLMLSIPSTALVVIFLKDPIAKAIAAPFRWLGKGIDWAGGKVSARFADWSLEREYLYRIAFTEKYVRFVGERGDADYSGNLELPAVFIPL